MIADTLCLDNGGNSGAVTGAFSFQSSAFSFFADGC
jgi:hypothetical protein